MSKFINIADLDSGNGKSYREMNAEKRHSFHVGQLVELDSGVRLFIAKITRDCDQTPLYCLTHEKQEDDYPLNENYWVRGYPEECLKLVK